MFTMPGIGELLVVMVIVLLIFGPGKLSQVGRSLGTAISEFKESIKAKDEKEKADLAKKEADKPANGGD